MMAMTSFTKITITSPITPTKLCHYLPEKVLSQAF